MNTAPYKRRIYIVDPPFQYGLIRKIAILAVVMVVMSLSFLVLVYYLYGDIQLELIQPDPFASSSGINTLEEKRTLVGLLWPVLGICLAVTLAMIFIFGILISHRMAGPIFRIRRVLSEMADGDIRGDIRLRAGDDFKHLAESVNLVKQNWRKSIQELQDLCTEIAPIAGKRKNERFTRALDILSGFKIN